MGLPFVIRKKCLRLIASQRRRSKEKWVASRVRKALMDELGKELEERPIRTPSYLENPPSLDFVQRSPSFNGMMQGLSRLLCYSEALLDQGPNQY